ncbi:hypothetical protein CRV00_14825, partial [Malaciobacter molluscorum]|uniref:hypothetical protein n=1 Tax=Malaciobacter molluscorum TaxID=1032072 RepID=UPI001025D010
LETVGIFTRQALKWRGGDERWRRFFALVSGAIAAAEGCPGVPEVSEDDEERRNEIVSLCHELDVFHVLPAYRSALKGIEREFNRNASYFLLSIIPSENRVTAEGFAASASQEANNSYTKREAELKSIPGAQAVLI